MLVVMAVVAVTVAAGALDPLPLATVGALVGAAGLLLSCAAGWVYHRQLMRALVRLQRCPPRWWWAPSRHHPLLDDDGRAQVLPWFRAGVAALAAGGVGLLLIVIALAKLALSP